MPLAAGTTPISTSKKCAGEEENGAFESLSYCRIGGITVESKTFFHRHIVYTTQLLE
jgi:hypothetical protein